MPKDERVARSQAQERRGVNRHGGTLNSGSGNGWSRKNDLRLDGQYLIEYKTTTGTRQSQITIKAKDTEDVWRNAVLEGRTPAFGIEVGHRDWVMVTADEFERLRSLDSAIAAGSVDGTLRDPSVEGPGLLLPNSRPREQGVALEGESRMQRRPRRPGSTPGVSSQGPVS